MKAIYDTINMIIKQQKNHFCRKEKPYLTDEVRKSPHKPKNRFAIFDDLAELANRLPDNYYFSVQNTQHEHSLGRISFL
jgi:histidinol phosphatase-like enzyme